MTLERPACDPGFGGLIPVQSCGNKQMVDELVANIMRRPGIPGFGVAQADD